MNKNELWTVEKIKSKRKAFFSKFRNFFIFDIETVPDDEMVKNVGTEEEIEKLENGEFLPTPFHRIVAVSFMTIKNSAVERFISFSSESETSLLNLFWENFKDAHTKEKNGIKEFPVIITVNGKDFDIPVIKSRSLKHIHHIKYSFYISIFLDRFDRFENEYPRYTNRYTPYHIDIPLDIFGKKMSLKNLCYLCDISVKTKGSGDKVPHYFKEKKLEKIAQYCLEDVKATAQLFAYINQFFLFGSYYFPSFENISNIEGEIKVI